MQTFYLGTHQVNWLAETTTPLFISYHRLRPRKRLPRARGRWALDSGGFSELSLRGRWTISAQEYVGAVRRYVDEIGGLDFACIQDHMCEPFVLNKTGRSLSQHLRSTVDSLLELRALAPQLPWAPVIQGFELADYLRCVELYDKAGIDLTKEAIVGVGSICRRQGTTDAVKILAKLSTLGIPLHGFGFKKTGLLNVQGYLDRGDSTAWSFHARRNPQERRPGCAHATCANCRKYGEWWYAGLMKDLAAHKRMQERQLSLWR